MNDPLFSREALGKFNTKPELHSRQQNTNSYVVKSEDGTCEKDMRTHVEKKLENCQLCNRRHDLDECKAFSDIVVAERSKFWQNRSCFMVAMKVFQQNTACNFPKRRTCKIRLGKHPTGLHGFQYKKKDWATIGNSQHQQKSETSNCANVYDIQYESIGTEDVLSMCVVPVKVQHNQSDKEIITFSMLDTCSQRAFVT